MDFEQTVITGFFVALGMAFTVGSIILTATLFRQYFRNWTQPKTQTLVMRIVLLVPIWAILGTINVALPRLVYISAVFMDLYEGYAIVTFMRLIYHYLGGKDQAQQKATLKHPYRFMRCLCLLTPGETLVKTLHVMVFQFAFTRPFFALLTCLLYYSDNLGEGSMTDGNVTKTVITCFTFSFLFMAMWALLQLYRIFNLILQPNNVGAKFMAIKIYIFFHAVQGFIFKSIEGGMEDSDRKLNIIRIEYVLVCFEMFLGAILNKYFFFKYQEYIDYEKEENQERIALDSEHKHASFEVSGEYQQSSS